jgi:hypothetical protein
VYYQKVADSGYNEDPAVKSFYFIAEVASPLNRQEEARKWYEELEERAPNSVYTNRLAERLDMQSPKNEQEEIEIMMTIADGDSTAQTAQNASQLVIADSSEAESIRPFVLLDEAKTYMRQGRNQPGFDEQIRLWFNEQQKIESKRNQFEELKDSARVMLADTTLSEEQHQYWQQIADSTFQAPTTTEVYPFEGAYWDSTRSILQRIENEYSASTVMPQVQVLQETLARPETESPEVSDSAPVEEQVITENKRREYPRCEDAGITMKIEGGIDSFMNTLTYPEWTEDVSRRMRRARRIKINVPLALVGSKLEPKTEL